MKGRLNSLFMDASGTSRLRIFFLLITLIILVIFYFRTPHPCKEPLTYRIGTIDERFGLSRQEFVEAVGKAASIWGKPFSRDLFREDPNGIIEVNLVYDYRQEASDKLKNLNYKIENTKNSYDDLKSRFENLKSEYEQKSTALAGDFNIYNIRANAFNAVIQSGRQRGGISEQSYKQLMTEKEELDAMHGNLKMQQEEMKNMADTINSLVVVINEIATNYNFDIVNYRDENNRLGTEFCEGNYTSKDGKQTITIYQFDNGGRLVRVLAHEFGHALGLIHNNSREAIMYRLNQSDSLELAPADIAALKARCGDS
jgi:predicted Zn-dependent protease